MGVPGWLLNIVMGFLSDRVMLVRFKGETTGRKPLPGEGPQGTLLGLLLFLIMINDCGFEENQGNIGDAITKRKKKFNSPTLHTKYVDDLTLLEAMNLKEVLVPNQDRPLPDPYHARLGLKLDEHKSKVYDQIRNTEAYATENDMKLNVAKCKFMLFNPTHNYDFIPQLQIQGIDIETMEELKLLGLVLTNYLKWHANTEAMVKKAYSRLWMIRRLKKHGANLIDLKEIFLRQIRSILKCGVPGTLDLLKVKPLK